MSRLQKRILPKYNSAQGTIEYLLIIAVVIVIALVVVGLVSGMFAPAQGITNTTNKITAQTSGLLALTELSVDTDGNYLVRILSNDPDNITIINVQVGDANTDYTTPLPQGSANNFIVNTTETCTIGFTTTKNITITYTTRYGITKKQILQNIQFTCENYSLPTNNTETTTTNYSYTWYFFIRLKLHPR